MPAKPPEYLKLKLSVARQIESTPDGLMDFRNICREQGHVRAFDLDKKRASDILHDLEKKTILRPGQYDKFVEILEIIGRDDVIQMLPGYEHYESKVMKETEDDNSSSRKGRQVGGKRSGTKRKSNDSSPGPSTFKKKKKIKVTESLIVSLARDIGINDNLERLGLELGFGLSDMKMYTAQNHAHGSVAYAGTKQMLIDWRCDKGERKPGILKKALINSGLTLYAEKYFDHL